MDGRRDEATHGSCCARTGTPTTTFPSIEGVATRVPAENPPCPTSPPQYAAGPTAPPLAGNPGGTHPPDGRYPAYVPDPQPLRRHPPSRIGRSRGVYPGPNPA